MVHRMIDGVRYVTEPEQAPMSCRGCVADDDQQLCNKFNNKVDCFDSIRGHVWVVAVSSGDETEEHY